MMAPIPILAAGVSRAELAELLDAAPLERLGVELRWPATDRGFSADPGMVTLLVDLAKAALPAVITALGVVWAARISRSAPKASPRIVIECVDGKMIELSIALGDPTDNVSGGHSPSEPTMTPNPTEISVQADEIRSLRLQK